MANGANESGYFQDGSFKLLLPDCALLGTGHQNTPLQLPAWNQHNPTLLRHGGNLNSIEVVGVAMRYAQGDGEAWLYNTLVALASCGLGDLYIGQTARSKYENCYFSAGEGEIVSGTDEGDDRCYVNYRLQFIQSAGEQPVSLSTGSSPPTAPPEYSGKDSTKTYTFGGTAMGLLSAGGLRIRVNREPLVKVLPRCYGARIKDRAQGAQGRTLEFGLDMTADPMTYPTHADFEEWFHELANNTGDEPGDLVGCGNTWADCHMTQMSHPGAAQWSHTAPNNIQLVYRQEDPAVDHSTLSNMEWSVCGHTMDTDLPMAGNDITGTGQDSAASGKYRFAYFDNSGNLIEGNADADDLTPPGGAMALNDLSDVTINAPAALRVLSYDSATEKWVDRTLATAGIAAANDLSSHLGDGNNPHVTTISNLDDTTIDGTPADNELLAYDTGSSKWINQTAAEAGLATAGHDHDASYSAIGHDHDASYAAIGHNHDATYLALAGGTMAGNIAMGGNDLTGTGQDSAAAGKYRIAFLDENGDLVEGASDRDDKSTPGGGTLTVEEKDSSPSVSADKIVFPNDSLTDLGSGDAQYWPHGNLKPGGLCHVHGRARLHTGTHAGDGVDGKDVSGFGFWPIFSLCKGPSTQLGVARFFRYGTKGFTNAAAAANRITRVDDDGIILGTDATVNSNGVTYYHFGFGAAAAPATGLKLVTGTYTGDGNDDRDITTTGVNPDLVWLQRNGSNYCVWKSDQHAGEATSYFAGVADLASDGIQSLGTAKFQVGANAAVNNNTETYFWAAFEAHADGEAEIVVGEYDTTATTVDELLIWCPWEPDIVVLSGHGIGLPIWATGDMTMPVACAFDTTANSTTAITELCSKGFWVGTDSKAQYAHYKYYYMAFKA